ncbi:MULTISPECIES: YbaB/EbfC family nucleoid-associated protein [Uliginosibacterium]|uniref:Nucleoid-associated protein HJ583_015240 n=1 Tax=Uliginosibacterium aquaticum TaxID=2731212 RepID=A0ABX2II16_9RHOO|nr:MULTISPECIES: YbaB/EbfC family nucleoid-associated protein [Uliginosibacterium]MDO6387341.1 YbaB/EbfC family nucleoid-associated protein [Uliginosibacterium sp. 31-12]NSL56390.1 YbaB/EbfC family nucleoid-associated protein [Uliginosibacterium aquaticum]PLK47144.1 YbaB/EbfC family nucleoid-associated protein [Uliginosibacterium sp. TH139]
MMKGGLAGLMKQAQQMQENMKKAQEALGQIDVEGSAGAGAVKVVMNCQNKVKRVQINEAVMDDREMLEDLIVTALNDAAAKAEAVSSEKMAGFTSGMGMPPGFKLPF